MKRILYIGVFWAVLAAVELRAQGADLSQADRFSSDSLGRYVYSTSIFPKWIEGTTCMYYDFIRLGERQDYLVDYKKGTRRLLFDKEDVADKMAVLLGEEIDPEKFNIYPEFEKGHADYFTFRVDGKYFKYDLKTDELTTVPPPTTKSRPFSNDSWKRWSPDSTYFVFGQRHNLWLGYRDGRDSIQLTNDGENYYSFVNSQNPSSDDKPHYVSGIWLADGNSFFVVREDKRRVGTLSIINSLSEPRPETTTYKFPMPGDADVPAFEAWLVDAPAGRVVRLDVEKYPDQKLDVPRFGVREKTSRYAYIVRRSRTGDRADLLRIDGRTHAVKELISENVAPYLNEQLFAFHVLNNGEEILWWSERSGRGQFYLYDGEGNLKNVVTPPDMQAGKVVRIDTVRRSLIVEGYGHEQGVNPYYRMYYKVGFDGKKLTLLTPGDGQHEMALSPDNSCFVDTYSRMDAEPRIELRDMKGRLRLALEQSDFSRLYERGWKKPQLVCVKAADDSTDLYGVMYVPFDLDSTRKYPVISNVYPGPQDDQISRRFILDDNYNQSLAQLGFVVLTIAPRGSGPLRGKAFQSFGYKNLRDYPLADDKYAIEQLARRYSFMDTTRVGIYGHSGGGFMSAAAIMTYPDFYKVAVSASGNHDNNIYTQWWGETFHGVDYVQTSDSTWQFESRIPTNMELAPNLKGRLLLITGDVDNNVHPACTFRLAKALIEAGKRFDMMIFPGVDHGVGGRYYTNLIRYYFVEHLLGEPQDDTDIINHN